MKTIFVNLVLLLLVIIVTHSMDGTEVKETRQRVVVIDTGIADIAEYKSVLCIDGHYNTTNKNMYDLKDTYGHGTNVISIISEGINAKTHCITVIKGIDHRIVTYESTEFILSALRKTLMLKNVAYVNLSLGGLNFEPQEFILLDLLMRKGTIVSVAAGNNMNKHMDKKCTYYPACSFTPSKQFNVVTSHHEDTNEGIDMGYKYESYCGGRPKMCGTSQATAFYTKRLLLGGIQ